MFLLLEADPQHHISATELPLAVVSWLTMSQCEAAHAAWQRHSKLTLQSSPQQQQQVFQRALEVLKEQPGAVAAALATDCCLLAAKLSMSDSSDQLQQLIDTLLAGHHRQEAYNVSCT